MDFFSYHSPRMPESLPECLKDNNLSRVLYGFVYGTLILSFIFAALDLLAGIITALVITVEEDPFAGLVSFVIAIVIAIGEMIAAAFIAAVIAALAEIVKNTKIAADAALYNAAVNAYGQKKDDAKCKEKAPVKIVTKKASEDDHGHEETVTYVIDSDPVSPITAESGEIICPICNTTQPRTRTKCKNCGQVFNR